MTDLTLSFIHSLNAKKETSVMPNGAFRSFYVIQSYLFEPKKIVNWLYVWFSPHAFCSLTFLGFDHEWICFRFHKSHCRAFDFIYLSAMVESFGQLGPDCHNCIKGNFVKINLKLFGAWLNAWAFWAFFQRNQTLAFW